MSIFAEGRRGRDEKPAAILDEKALAFWPGPALLVGAGGAIVFANDRARPVRDAVSAGLFPDFPGLLTGGRTQAATLVGAGGSLVVFELTPLPSEGGAVLVIGRDVTLERNLRSALVESRQRYKDLVDISSDFAWEVGADGRFAFVSPRGALGFSADELVGRDPSDFLADRGYDRDASPFRSGLSVEDSEVWMVLADGGQACVLASSTPIRNDSGEWLGARGICRDVTQERLRDAALSRANNRERLLSYIVRTIRDEVDPVDMLRAAAEATARALGAGGCQIFRLLPDASDFALAAQFGDSGEEKDVLDSFIQSDHYEDKIGNRHALATVSRYRQSINGALLLWRSVDRPGWSDDDRLLIDDVANQVGLANEQIINHERILRLSRTDSLTGLFNRRAFFEEIARRFQRLARERRPASLIYVDLDNFKAVNDVHGHQTGDQALLAVRELLLQNTRPTDLVARLGGDEFAIWLDGAEEHIAVRRSEGILASASALAQYSGSAEKPLHMSLGVAVHSGKLNESLDDLVARADAAMYAVKREGKGSWRLAPEPQAAAKE